MATALVVQPAASSRADPPPPSITVVYPESLPAFREAARAAEAHLTAQDVPVAMIDVGEARARPVERWTARDGVVIAVGREALALARRAAPDVSRVAVLVPDLGCPLAPPAPPLPRAERGEARTAGETRPGETRPGETPPAREGTDPRRPAGAVETGIWLDVHLENLVRTLLSFTHRRPIRTIGLAVPADGPCRPDQIEAAIERAAPPVDAVVSGPIGDRKELIFALRRLAQETDALVLLPGGQLINEDTLRLALLYGLEARIPVVGFSEAAVASGALLAELLEPDALGRQAAGKALDLLAGGASPMTFSKPTLIGWNQRTANLIGSDSATPPDGVRLVQVVQ